MIFFIICVLVELFINIVFILFKEGYISAAVLNTVAGVVPGSRHIPAAPVNCSILKVTKDGSQFKKLDSQKIRNYIKNIKVVTGSIFY
jgi:hypothetical protein